MRLLSGFCIVACVASAITALELEKVKQKDETIAQKQEKRSLSNDEWSSAGVGPYGSSFAGAGGYIPSGSFGGAGLYGSSIGGIGGVAGSSLDGGATALAGAGVGATAVGVSSHTDTLTTVREQVPVPVDRPLPFPVDRPVPYPVVRNIPQPYPVEVIKHVDRPV